MNDVATAPLDFRAAGEADVDRLVELVESAYRGDRSRAGWTTEADLLHGQRTDAAAVRDVIGADGSVVVVGSRAGRIVACCHLERRAERTYFGMFAVDPALQAGGIGAQVIGYAETYARTAWSSTHLEMTVIRQRAELIAYYERRGFANTHIRSPFPYGDERFGVPQRDDLEMVLLEKTLV